MWDIAVLYFIRLQFHYKIRSSFNSDYFLLSKPCYIWECFNKLYYCWSQVRNFSDVLINHCNLVLNESGFCGCGFSVLPCFYNRFSLESFTNFLSLAIKFSPKSVADNCFQRFFCLHCFLPETLLTLVSSISTKLFICVYHLLCLRTIKNF